MSYVVLCNRVATHPLPGFPGSEQGSCSTCGGKVWLSPASRKVLAAVSGGVAKCLECAEGDRYVLHTTEAHLHEQRERLLHVTETRN